MRQTFEFLKAAIRSPMEVSTVFPTSKFLANRLLDHANLGTAKSVVELGCGTGAITRHLQPRLSRRDSYLGIEISSQMVSFLNNEFPTLKFAEGRAEDLATFVKPGSVDAVVSSLPWTIFSKELQTTTLDEIHQALRPGGTFVTYVCVNAMVYPNAQAFFSAMASKFDRIERSPIELLNVPPAYVYQATK